jgi:outer membrane lipoprotein carrier protein
MTTRRQFVSNQIALIAGLSSRRLAVPWLQAGGLLGGVGALPTLAVAQTKDSPKTQEGIEQLREFMIGAKSARGEFEQKLLKTSGASENTSGSFSFVRPGKFRWEVKKPYSQLMVSDGSQLFFFDKDLNQVVIRKLSDVLGATPAAILFGSNEFERNFKLTALASKGEVEWVEALPVVSGSREAGFEKMNIGFKGSLPVGMEVKDAFGRTSVFSFTGMQRNAPISDNEFKFTIPAGAEVVRQ